MDTVFFANEGLTSTSANHIANLAKEYYLNLEKDVENNEMYTTSVELIGGSTVHIVTKGVTAEHLLSLEEKLHRIAEAKSLIAWLREAIKAREIAKKNIDNMSFSEYYKEYNIEMPEEPERDSVLTEREYFNNLNIKERNRYYHLETLCAVLGNYIHPNGSFAVARTSYYDKLNSPTKISGNGRDTLLYKYDATVSKDDIESVYFKLQDTYRKYQAELNGMKHACQLAIEKSEQEVAEKYKREYLDYTAKVRDYEAKMKELTLQFQDKQREALLTLQSLKIVIPNDLKEIYNLVKSLK